MSEIDTRRVLRSQHVDRFNHDEDAAGYDEDVRSESDPIRAGYRALLQWVAEQTNTDSTSTIWEIGSGTGNLTALLPACARIHCFDVSSKMTRIAKEKLESRSPDASGGACGPEITFTQADALECLTDPHFENDTPNAIVSTYTLHHLTETEKRRFTDLALQRLQPGGRLVIGDLGFENGLARDQILASYRNSGRQALAEEIEDEFFWLWSAASEQLEEAGKAYDLKRFSELSWGLLIDA